MDCTRSITLAEGVPAERMEALFGDTEVMKGVLLSRYSNGLGRLNDCPDARRCRRRCTLPAGLGFGVYGLGFRVKGLGFRVRGFRFQGFQF